MVPMTSQFSLRRSRAIREMNRSNRLDWIRRPAESSRKGPERRLGAGLKSAVSTALESRKRQSGDIFRSAAYRIVARELAASTRGVCRLSQPPIRPQSFTSIRPLLRRAPMLVRPNIRAAAAA